MLAKSLELIVILLTATLSATPVQANNSLRNSPVRLVTWNIYQLGDGINDENPRSEDDYQRLKNYTAGLDADIIALQEVENVQAVEKLFSADRYRIYLTRDNRDNFHSSNSNFQTERLALLIDKSIDAHVDELDALDINGWLRGGLDARIIINGKPLRLLAIHLKGGCHTAPLSNNNTACKQLNRQTRLLDQWIGERSRENVPFIIMGDWNRQLNQPGDDLWRHIDNDLSHGGNSDLINVTRGRPYTCWPNVLDHYIDHIVLDQKAARWRIHGSFREYRFPDDSLPDPQDPYTLFRRLSDHCAIGVQMNIR